MKLYASLFVALFAHAVSAATIPEDIPVTEKELNVIVKPAALRQWSLINNGFGGAFNSVQGDTVLATKNPQAAPATTEKPTNPIATVFSQIGSTVLGIFMGPAHQSTDPPAKPNEKQNDSLIMEPEKSPYQAVLPGQAQAVTPDDYLKQIVQNNIIARVIDKVFQMQQNDNNQKEPAISDGMEEAAEELTNVESEPMGQPLTIEENTTTDGSKIEESERVQEIQNENQEPKKEVVELKKEDVVDKTTE